MSEFSVVDRPTSHRGRRVSALQAAVRDTAETGKAIRIPLNGEPPYKLRNRLYQSVRPVGLLLHIKQDGEGYILEWCEKRRAAEPAP